MVDNPVRAVFVTAELKERFAEAAWRQRTTTSALVTAGINRFLANPDLAKNLPDGTAGSGVERISFRIDKHNYELATALIEAQGGRISHLVRGLLLAEAEKVNA
jgi:hypothetical protein